MIGPSTCLFRTRFAQCGRWARVWPCAKVEVGRYLGRWRAFSPHTYNKRQTSKQGSPWLQMDPVLASRGALVDHWTVVVLVDVDLWARAWMWLGAPRHTPPLP